MYFREWPTSSVFSVKSAFRVGSPDIEPPSPELFVIGECGTTTNESIRIPGMSSDSAGFSTSSLGTQHFKWSWWRYNKRPSWSFTRKETGPVTYWLMAGIHFCPVPKFWAYIHSFFFWKVHSMSYTTVRQLLLQLMLLYSFNLHSAWADPTVCNNLEGDTPVVLCRVVW